MTNRKRLHVVARVMLALCACLLVIGGAVRIGMAQTSDDGLVPLAPMTVEVPASEGGQSNDELLGTYVQRVLDEAIPGADELRTQSVGRGLTGPNAIVYTKLREAVASVAAGECQSTVFTVNYSDFNVDLGPWSAEDLGVDTISEGVNITGEAWQAVCERVPLDLNVVLNALEADCPYELYWYDKTSTGGTSLDWEGFSLGYSGGTEVLYCSDVYVQVKMYVAKEFSADDSTGGTEVRQGIATAAFAARDKAVGIVDECVGLTPYERLDAYRAAICKEVDYNDDAAEGGVAYGNPWQLIWVFDGVEDTKVVCEGYSKAFKYLCDLTWPEDDSGENPLVECLLVSGYMAGGTGAGRHMWNVVRADDGGNYLVDVTNCDDGTIGAPNKLFMAYGPEGSYEDQYNFLVTGAYSSSYVCYKYDSITYQTFSEEVLTISSTPYTPPALPEPADLSGAAVTFGAPSYTYAAVELEPAPIVTLDGKELVLGEDYTCSYAANKNVGTATVTVTGKGSYTGEVTGTFQIERATLQGLDWTDLAFVYDGSTHCPTASAVGLLADDVTGVTVEGEQTDAGTYVAQATALSNPNYQLPSSASVEFSIAPGSSTIVLESLSATCDGKAHAYDGAVTRTGSAGAVTYAYFSDAGCTTAVDAADVVDAGIYYVVATLAADKNHDGATSDPVELSIARGASSISLEPRTATYDGKAHAYDGAVTRTGSSGAVTYAYFSDAGCTTVVDAADVVDAGTYYVVATLAADKNHDGATSEPVAFVIRTATTDISAATVTAPDQTYTGEALEPTPTITLDGQELDPADFDVAYDANTHAGTATVTVTAREGGAYEGSASGSFAIAPAAITSVGAVADQTYTGSAIKPALTVRAGSIALAKADYDVAFANNVHAGTATATVTAKAGGDFSGSATATFAISPADISAAKVTASDGAYVGKALEPAPTVTLDGRQLTLGTDYDVSYANNTGAGTAIVTVTAREGGDYVGSASGSFRIIKAAQPMKASAVARSVEYYPLQSASQTVACPLAVSGNKGTVRYAKAIGSAALAVDAASGRVTVAKGTAAGTYTLTVRVTAAGDANHEPGSCEVSCEVKVADTRKANPMTVSAKAVTAGSFALRTGAATVAPIAVSGAKGKVTYKRASGSTKLSVDATTGKVTVAKGTGDGTYIAKFTVSAAGDATYKPAAKTVEVTVKVADTRKANPMKVSTKAVTAGSFALKTKAATVAPIAVSGAKGKVAYKKASGSAQLSVDATTGKVTVKKGTKAGTYTAKVTVSAAGDATYKPATKTVEVTVKVADTRKANPIKVTVATKTASAKALKTKAATVAPIAVSGAKGKVAYKKASGSAQLSVDASTGKVTVKKGTKAGTYNAKVTVSAAGDATYKNATKTVTVKVTVK